jgi:hypothetical protein
MPCHAGRLASRFWEVSPAGGRAARSVDESGRGDSDPWASARDRGGELCLGAGKGGWGGVDALTSPFLFCRTSPFSPSPVCERERLTWPRARRTPELGSPARPGAADGMPSEAEPVTHLPSLASAHGRRSMARGGIGDVRLPCRWFPPHWPSRQIGGTCPGRNDLLAPPTTSQIP